MSTTLEAAERNAFVDQIIDDTCHTLADPEVDKRLAIYAKPFIEKLHSAVIPNVRNGTIEIPRERLGDVGSLAIVAVHSGEQLELSRDFGTQTPRQANNTIKQLQAWGTAQDVYDTYLDILEPSGFGESTGTVVLGTQARAVTSASTYLFSGSSALNYFSAPIKGIVGIQHRPLILLGMEGSQPLRDSEVAHELGHVELSESAPIINVWNQRGVNLWSLRTELFASSIGASIAYVRLSRQKNGFDADSIASDSAALQIAVESVRLGYAGKYGMDPIDPYKPTGGLLKMIQDHGFGDILHMVQDYDELERRAHIYESSVES